MFISGILVTLQLQKSLGNHEFDEQVSGVIPFINNVSTPVLAANLILDNVPELKNLSNLYNSTILIVNGVKVGIIGYLTPDTKFSAPINKVEYEDEITALKREVKRLQDQDVNILIALGHSGFIRDLQIAQQVEDIDLVIGGHSNTFLLNQNSTNETPETVEGPYPTWVTQASGRKVPVVQAYAYTKYLGRLHLVFDAKGKIIECDGTPILLTQNIPRDPKLLKLVEKYRSSVESVSNEIVGSTYTFLNGACRLRECNLGNMITDADLYYTKKFYHDQYPDVNIAVIQGGRIRTSIKKGEGPPFQLTRGDWIAVLPFGDPLAIVTMNGTVLMQTLEHSVDSWRLIDTPGQFLQVSGIQVTYDLARPPGSRVVEAVAVCSNCSNTPKLAKIQPDFYYKIIMSSFLSNSGDRYTMFEGLEKELVPYDELTAVYAYLKEHSPIAPTVLGRVMLLNEDKVDSGFATSIPRGGRSLTSSAVTTHYKLNFVLIVSCLLICTILML